MVRYKVRPSRQLSQTPCAVELSTLLACFASTGDLRAAGEGSAGCATAARNLHLCMAKTGKGGSRRASTINHYLAKIK